MRMTQTKIRNEKKANVVMVEMRIGATFAILKEIMNMMSLSHNDNCNKLFEQNNYSNKIHSLNKFVKISVFALSDRRDGCMFDADIGHWHT